MRSLRLLGVPGVGAEDVLAIGDGRNDVDMLEWAGRGVAMGQAPAEVLAAATRVTAPVEEDGLALVLEELLARHPAAADPLAHAHLVVVALRRVDPTVAVLDGAGHRVGSLLLVEVPGAEGHRGGELSRTQGRVGCLGWRHG